MLSACTRVFTRGNIFPALEARRARRDVATIAAISPRGRIATCPGENMTRPSHSVLPLRPALSPFLPLPPSLSSRGNENPENVAYTAASVSVDGERQSFEARVISPLSLSLRAHGREHEFVQPGSLITRMRFAFITTVTRET